MLTLLMYVNITIVKANSVEMFQVIVIVFRIEPIMPLSVPSSEVPESLQLRSPVSAFTENNNLFDDR